MNSEISLDTADSASNAVVKRFVFINQPCAQCVCLYSMDFVSAGKNALLLYMTVCEKVVPWLDKYDDVCDGFVSMPPLISLITCRVELHCLITCRVELHCFVVRIARRCPMVASFVPGVCCIALQMLICS